MKTLLVLRHAKSSWKEPDLSDHQRPLNNRGLKAAPRMGELIRERELTPDAILSSTAVRARQTAELVAEHCGFAGRLLLIDDLYLAPPRTYVTYLSQLPDDARIAMVVGHNPGLEGLVGAITGQAVTMPTAALAEIRFEIPTWHALPDFGRGRLANLWLPREL